MRAAAVLSCVILVSFVPSSFADLDSTSETNSVTQAGWFQRISQVFDKKPSSETINTAIAGDAHVPRALSTIVYHATNVLIDDKQPASIYSPVGAKFRIRSAVKPSNTSPTLFPASEKVQSATNDVPTTSTTVAPAVNVASSASSIICNTTATSIIRNRRPYPTLFCNKWDAAKPHITSPFKKLTVKQVSNACGCILAGPKLSSSSTLTTVVPAVIATSSSSAVICNRTATSIVRKNRSHPTLFCNSWDAARPHTTSPFTKLTVKQVNNACGCILAPPVSSSHSTVICNRTATSIVRENRPHPTLFCNNWNAAKPHIISPFDKLTAKQVDNACGCILARTTSSSSTVKTSTKVSSRLPSLTPINSNILVATFTGGNQLANPVTTSITSMTFSTSSSLSASSTIISGLEVLLSTSSTSITESPISISEMSSSLTTALSSRRLPSSVFSQKTSESDASKVHPISEASVHLSGSVLQTAITTTITAVSITELFSRSSLQSSVTLSSNSPTITSSYTAASGISSTSSDLAARPLETTRVADPHATLSTVLSVPASSNGQSGPESLNIGSLDGVDTVVVSTQTPSLHQAAGNISASRDTTSMYSLALSTPTLLTSISRSSEPIAVVENMSYDIPSSSVVIASAPTTLITAAVLATTSIALSLPILNAGNSIQNGRSTNDKGTHALSLGLSTSAVAGGNPSSFELIITAENSHHEISLSTVTTMSAVLPQVTGMSGLGTAGASDNTSVDQSFSGHSTSITRDQSSSPPVSIFVGSTTDLYASSDTMTTVVDAIRAGVSSFDDFGLPLNTLTSVPADTLLLASNVSSKILPTAIPDLPTVNISTPLYLTTGVPATLTTSATRLSYFDAKTSELATSQLNGVSSDKISLSYTSGVEAITINIALSNQTQPIITERISSSFTDQVPSLSTPIAITNLPSPPETKADPGPLPTSFSQRPLPLTVVEASSPSVVMSSQVGDSNSSQTSHANFTILESQLPISHVTSGAGAITSDGISSTGRDGMVGTIPPLVGITTDTAGSPTTQSSSGNVHLSSQGSFEDNPLVPTTDVLKYLTTNQIASTDVQLPSLASIIASVSDTASSLPIYLQTISVENPIKYATPASSDRSSSTEPSESLLPIGGPDQPTGYGFSSYQLPDTAPTTSAQSSTTSGQADFTTFVGLNIDQTLNGASLLSSGSLLPKSQSTLRGSDTDASTSLGATDLIVEASTTQDSGIAITSAPILPVSSFVAGIGAILETTRIEVQASLNFSSDVITNSQLLSSNTDDVLIPSETFTEDSMVPSFMTSLLTISINSDRLESLTSGILLSSSILASVSSDVFAPLKPSTATSSKTSTILSSVGLGDQVSFSSESSATVVVALPGSSPFLSNASLETTSSIALSTDALQSIDLPSNSLSSSVIQIGTSVIETQVPQNIGLASSSAKLDLSDYTSTVRQPSHADTSNQVTSDDVVTVTISVSSTAELLQSVSDLAPFTTVIDIPSNQPSLPDSPGNATNTASLPFSEDSTSVYVTTNAKYADLTLQNGFLTTMPTQTANTAVLASGQSEKPDITGMPTSKISQMPSGIGELYTSSSLDSIAVTQATSVTTMDSAESSTISLNSSINSGPSTTTGLFDSPTTTTSLDLSFIQISSGTTNITSARVSALPLPSLPQPSDLSIPSGSIPDSSPSGLSGPQIWPDPTSVSVGPSSRAPSQFSTALATATFSMASSTSGLKLSQILETASSLLIDLSLSTMVSQTSNAPLVSTGSSLFLTSDSSTPSTGLHVPLTSQDSLASYMQVTHSPPESTMLDVAESSTFKYVDLGLSDTSASATSSSTGVQASGVISTGFNVSLVEANTSSKLLTPNLPLSEATSSEPRNQATSTAAVASETTQDALVNTTPPPNSQPSVLQATSGLSSPTIGIEDVSTRSTATLSAILTPSSSASDLISSISGVLASFETAPTQDSNGSAVDTSATSSRSGTGQLFSSAQPPVQIDNSVQSNIIKIVSPIPGIQQTIDQTISNIPSSVALSVVTPTGSISSQVSASSSSLASATIETSDSTLSDIQIESSLGFVTSSTTTSTFKTLSSSTQSLASTEGSIQLNGQVSAITLANSSPSNLDRGSALSLQTQLESTISDPATSGPPSFTISEQTTSSVVLSTPSLILSSSIVSALTSRPLVSVQISNSVVGGVTPVSTSSPINTSNTPIQQMTSGTSGGLSSSPTISSASEAQLIIPITTIVSQPLNVESSQDSNIASSTPTFFSLTSTSSTPTTTQVISQPLGSDAAPAVQTGLSIGSTSPTQPSLVTMITAQALNDASTQSLNSLLSSLVISEVVGITPVLSQVIASATAGTITTSAASSIPEQTNSGSSASSASTTSAQSQPIVSTTKVVVQASSSVFDLTSILTTTSVASQSAMYSFSSPLSSSSVSPVQTSGSSALTSIVAQALSTFVTTTVTLQTSSAIVSSPAPIQTVTATILDLSQSSRSSSSSTGAGYLIGIGLGGLSVGLVQTAGGSNLLGLGAAGASSSTVTSAVAVLTSQSTAAPVAVAPAAPSSSTLITFSTIVVSASSGTGTTTKASIASASTPTTSTSIRVSSSTSAPKFLGILRR